MLNTKKKSFKILLFLPLHITIPRPNASYIKPGDISRLPSWFYKDGKPLPGFLTQLGRFTRRPNISIPSSVFTATVN